MDIQRRKLPDSKIQTFVLNYVRVLPVCGGLHSSNWKMNEDLCRFLPGE